MPQTQTIDVSRLVDDRKIGALNIKILIITSLLAMFEGYDQSSLGFVAPALIRDWHIVPRGDLGPVFSVVVFGNLIGAPVFGYIGDRFGRKNAILLSILLFAVFTIATPFTSDLKLLFYVRLLVGFGLGGALPNLVAINADFAPKTARATMIIIMSCGLTAGAGVVGLITAWLMPQLRANHREFRRHVAGQRGLGADRHVSRRRVRSAAAVPPARPQRLQRDDDPVRGPDRCLRLPRRGRHVAACDHGAPLRHRRVHPGRPGRAPCAAGHDLPDIHPCERRRLGLRHRPVRHHLRHPRRRDATQYGAAAVDDVSRRVGPLHHRDARLDGARGPIREAVRRCRAAL